MTKSALLVSTAVGLTLAVTPSLAAKNNATHPSLNTVHQAGLKGWNGATHGVVTPAATTLAMTWSVTTLTNPGGFKTDPTSLVAFKCKVARKTGKCTVITESVAEVDSAGTTASTFDNQAICPVLNTVFTNGSCYYSGQSTSDQFYHTITNDTNGSGGTNNTGYVILYSPHAAVYGHRQNQWHL